MDIDRGSPKRGSRDVPNASLVSVKGIKELDARREKKKERCIRRKSGLNDL